MSREQLEHVPGVKRAVRRGRAEQGWGARPPGRAPGRGGQDAELSDRQAIGPSSGVVRQGRGAEKGVGFADLQPQEPAGGGAGVWDRPCRIA